MPRTSTSILHNFRSRVIDREYLLIFSFANLERKIERFIYQNLSLGVITAARWTFLIPKFVMRKLMVVTGLRQHRSSKGVASEQKNDCASAFNG